jgi:predicted nucleotidyltransferase
MMFSAYDIIYAFRSSGISRKKISEVLTIAFFGDAAGQIWVRDLSHNHVDIVILIEEETERYMPMAIEFRDELKEMEMETMIVSIAVVSDRTSIISRPPGFDTASSHRYDH